MILAYVLNALVSDVVDRDEERLKLLTTVTKISQDEDTVIVTTDSGAETESTWKRLKHLWGELSLLVIIQISKV